MNGRVSDTTREEALAALVERARDGDGAAVEALLRAVRDEVYRLALRMLAQPADAEDAAQEILVKVLTRLDSFRGEAGVRTWVYRIAVNHLLDRRRSAHERARPSFREFAEDLATGLAERAAASGPEEALLAEEVKLGCTLGMLQCLDRAQRAAYILGEVFDLPGEQAAAVLGTTPAAYRKRLSRARGRIRRFMGAHCGLVEPAAACRCGRRVERAIELGRVDPERLRLARHPRAVETATAEMEGLHAAARVMRAHPAYAAPDSVSEALREALRSGRLEILAAER